MSVYSDYARGAGNLIMGQGAAQADATRQSGAIWANTLGNLGNIALAVPEQRRQESELRQRQQVVDANQKRIDAAEASRLAVSNALGKAIGPDGKINKQIFIQQLQNTPDADKIPDVIKFIDSQEMGDLTLREKRNQLEQDERAQFAQIGDTAATLTSPENQAGFLVTQFARLIKGGQVDPEHVQQWTQGMLDEDGRPNPEKVAATIQGIRSKAQPKAPTAPTETTLAVDAFDPTSPTAGRSRQALDRLKPIPVKPEPPERPQTETSLAIDAATVGTPDETPTAKRSKAALDRLRPVRPAAGADPAVAASQVGATFPDVPPGQKNEDFIKSLNGPDASMVKALAEGRMAFPSGIALSRPYWQDMLAKVAKYDPGFDTATASNNVRAKTRAAFTSGKEAGQVNAINTAIGHMDALLKTVDALNNFTEGSLGPATTLANDVKNWLRSHTGSSTINEFNVVRKAVSDELTRVWRQSGGSESDIQENMKNLDISGTPEQLYGAVRQFGHLLESKLDSLNEQYRQGMGTDKIDMVTPEAKKVLEKLAGSPSGVSPRGVQVTINGKSYSFPTQQQADAFKKAAGQ